MLSGITDEIETLSKILTAHRMKYTKLEATLAFQSSQVDDIFNDFEPTIKAVAFEKPLVPSLASLLRVAIMM